MAEKHCHDGAQGMTFGIMDAIINVVGILVGLGVIGNKTAVLLGILVAGIANSFGNAAGFHVSEETEGIHTRREVWVSTAQAFLGTFIVTLLLIVPPLVFDLTTGIMVSVVCGVVALMGLGFFVSRRFKHGKKQTLHIMFEYTIIGIVVIIISYLLGSLVIFLTGQQTY